MRAGGGGARGGRYAALSSRDAAGRHQQPLDVGGHRRRRPPLVGIGVRREAEIAASALRSLC
jgi:hypothetical protein